MQLFVGLNAPTGNALGSCLCLGNATPHGSEEVDPGKPQQPRSKPKIRRGNPSIVGKPNLPADYPKRTENTPIMDRKLVRPPGFEPGFLPYGCRPEAVRPVLAGLRRAFCARSRPRPD